MHIHILCVQVAITLYKCCLQKMAVLQKRIGPAHKVFDTKKTADYEISVFVFTHNVHLITTFELLKECYHWLSLK